MKLSEISKKLELKAYNQCNADVDVKEAYASDLLSDVMGKAKSGQIWITMQTHKNVAAVASLKDMPAIIIVNNGEPDADMLEHSEEEEIAVFSTPLSTYQLSAMLYNIIN